MNPNLHRRFAQLEEQKEKLQESFDRWSKPQLHFQPGPQQWSLLQVFDHIIKVDISVIKSLLKHKDEVSEEILGFDSWRRALFLRLFLLSPFKVKAPKVPGIEPMEPLDLQSVVVGWGESRSFLRVYLEQFPEDKWDNFVFNHPYSGKLTIAQTLMFIYCHIRHHDYQIKRIISHSEFPKEASDG